MLNRPKCSCHEFQVMTDLVHIRTNKDKLFTVNITDRIGSDINCIEGIIKDFGSETSFFPTDDYRGREILVLLIHDHPSYPARKKAHAFPPFPCRGYSSSSRQVFMSAEPSPCFQ